MNFIKNNGIATAMLISLLCSFFSVNAISNITTIDNSEALTPPIITAKFSLKVDGGPRNIIRLKTSIIIIQGDPETMYIKIRDNNSNVVYQNTVTALEAEVSTSGWDTGNYTVETTCDDNDYQVFYFLVEN
jgi:hypothetical protein